MNRPAVLLLSLLSLCLEACYPANGAPPEDRFWLKSGIGKSQKSADWSMCAEQSLRKLGDAERKAFEEGQSAYREGLRTNAPFPFEVPEGYDEAAQKHREQTRQCLYGLGYRFTASLYWCLAQDGGDNWGDCRRYRKYRR